MQIKSDYKTELEKNGTLAFVPAGNSMWPTLKNRRQSVIVVKKIERLKPFDVAFYQRENGSFVLHRIMEVTPEGYLVCGDSQLSIEKVKEEQVFGVMIGFYRGKKYIDVSLSSHVKRIKRWYERKKWRKFRLRVFYFTQSVKRRLKKILKKGEIDV